MDLIHLIILGFVQGLTEFLPISSAAHLILVPQIMGWPDQGLAYDVAAHVGSFGAVVFYFWNDLRRIVQGWTQARFSLDHPDGRYVWFLCAGTLPVAVIGLLAHHYVETVLRNPIVIAAATIFFGLVLWWADVTGKRARGQADLNWRDAILIGLSQVLALVPGTSRSGITITAGLMLGLTRETAARFSFLLAIPTIVLAGGYETLQLFSATDPIDFMSIAVVAGVSGVTAAVTIHYFLKFLETTRMLPYVIYRLVLGAFLLYFFL